MVHAPRNKLLAPGIERFTRSQMYAKKALYKKKKVAVTKPVAESPTTKTVEVKGAKNGKSRTVPLKKLPKFYPAEDVQVPKKSRKNPKPANLRGNITPGTVLVLLAGRYRGKRVVFLKQLESGLLLVSGPFKLNGVPLRRVNQAYVLATSTKVDISKVQLSEKLNDAFFKKVEDKKAKKPTEEGLFKDGKKVKVAADPAHVAEQKVVDAALVEAVKAVPELTSYIKSSFSLQNGQYPHLMKF